MDEVIQKREIQIHKSVKSIYISKCKHVKCWWVMWWLYTFFCTTKGQGSVLGYDRIWMHNLVIPASSVV